MSTLPAWPLVVVFHRLNLVPRSHERIDVIGTDGTLGECVHLDFVDDFLGEAVRKKVGIKNWIFFSLTKHIPQC